MASDGKLSYS